MTKYYYKKTSKKIIDADLALMYKLPIDSLLLPGENKELCSLLIALFNFGIVYPDPLCNLYFVYMLFLLLTGAYEVRKAKDLREESAFLAKVIYQTLLPSLIVCDTELPSGDFYLYNMLISDIKDEGILQRKSSFHEICKYSFDKLYRFINEAKMVITKYLDAGYDECDPEIEEIKQLIMGFITEIPHYENENAYYESLKSIELKLITNQRRPKKSK